MTEIQRIPCSAARAVEAFSVDGADYLVIPQLAYDDPATPAGMNGGTSGTDVLVLRRSGDCFEAAGTLPGVGGEDAEFFTIDGTSYLAIACIRMGSGPYNYEVGQPIYVWKDGAFAPFQTILGYAAKEWRHFTVDGTHFLALAQNRAGERDVPSAIFRWNGVRFEHFQDIPSRGGYNFQSFELGGTTYLAHADHELPSTLYRWDGEKFVFHQELVELGGRAFELVSDGSSAYLVIANIRSDSVLLRWDGRKFRPHQVLDGGPGARELTVIETADGTFVVRVNFITGGPQAPHPVLKSQVYRLENNLLTLVDEYDTCGGTDVTSFVGPDGGIQLAVSSGLNADIGFRTESIIYRFDPR
jgi:hypothetical protein